MRPTSRIIQWKACGFKDALFSLPALMDSSSFAKYVNRCGRQLEHLLLQNELVRFHHLKCAAFEQEVAERAKVMCEPLVSLNRIEVENIVLEKYGLKDERLVTCLVPYQLGANIILSKMPLSIRSECISELRAEEEKIRAGGSIGGNTWIQWKEADVYVSTGLNYLRNVSKVKKLRIPTFVVVGHVNHGKTTLLDSLQDSNVAEHEPHFITQSIRCFTTRNPIEHNEMGTFIDTPGHRLFAEMRFHAQLIADYVILVVSVTDGIQSQTHECVKVALNVDKPIIVVLTKIDLLPDSFTAHREVQRILSGLDQLGLDVNLIRSDKDISFPAELSMGSSASTVTDVTHSEDHQYFLPMKKLDPSYVGSIRKPSLHLSRKCVGVCVSSRKQVNIPLLWRILHQCQMYSPSMCHSTTANHSDHNCSVQAVVVESSKHLFDEEGFRQSRARQRIQGRVDSSEARGQRKLEKKSVSSRVNSAANALVRKSPKANRTSSSTLVVTAIVREGVVTRGMNFVSDQAEGRVDELIDFWGNSLERATPGMAVTLIDTHSMSGCPGVGIHVLSTVDEATRLRVHGFRQILQWYAECFPTKLHYLKPRGMDASFVHLGDYGQIACTESLEYQLLYGSPPRKEGSRPTLPGDAQSFGEYLLEKNREDELQGSKSNSLCVHNDNTSKKRIGQAIVAKAEEEVLHTTWKDLQPSSQISSQEEYEEFLHQCIQIGVLLKVDSWHSARMLYREIPRLGTRKVALHVLGVRFGALSIGDLQFFGQSAKVIICYRTPKAGSNEVDHAIESNGTWLLETDHLSDILTFVKWCAVTTHKEHVYEDKTDHGVRIHITGKSTRTDASTPEPAAGPTERRPRLLRYITSSDSDASYLSSARERASTKR